MVKKILLTGASGFIGKNIYESYLSEKYNIIAPNRAKLDLLDDYSVANFFKNNRGFDAVIHSACKPGHRNSKNSQNIFYSNSRIFFNLAKYHDSFGKLINIGSGAIYDMRHYQPKMSEEYFGKFIPADEHGFTKYVIEKYSENSALDMVDLRIFGIFGKYEDYAIRFISNLICKAIFDLPLTMKQNRKFDYLYVNDLMPILEFFIENKSLYKSYNVTPNNSIELFKISTIIKKVLQKELPIVISSEGLGTEYSGSNVRLLSEIKNCNFTDIEQAIKELSGWYLNNKNSIDINLLLTDK